MSVLKLRTPKIPEIFATRGRYSRASDAIGRSASMHDALGFCNHFLVLRSKSLNIPQIYGQFRFHDLSRSEFGEDSCRQGVPEISRCRALWRFARIKA